jgi:type IV secretory pathway TrbD component
MRRASKIHGSLAREKLLMGVGSHIFGLEVSLLVLAINLRSVPLALLVVPSHFFFRWVHRKDPLLVTAYRRYVKEPDLYDPWVRKAVKEARPTGFGRGLHC